MTTILQGIERNMKRIAQGGLSGSEVSLPQAQTASILPDPPDQIPSLPNRGPWPSQFSLNTDFTEYSATFQKNTVRSRAFPVPPNTNTQKTTTIVQQVSSNSTSIELETNNVNNPNQQKLNLLAGTDITLASDVNGGVTINASGAGFAPNLAIGDIFVNWPQSDPASVILVDDFFGFVAYSADPLSPSIGQLGWQTVGSLNGAVTFPPLYPPSYGAVRLNRAGGSANSLTALQLLGFNPVTSTACGFALTYLTGWECQIVFQFPKWSESGALNPQNKCRMYLGFGAYCVSSPVTAQGRPAKFIGLRYDTDPGFTLPLTAAANASSGNTTYTGTITNGGNTPSPFIGQSIVVAGFTNAANNGTFTCVSSTSTQIVLANPIGVAETHAGTATTPGIGDTHYQFEFLQNIQPGNNLQGTTISSGIAPDYNQHRFRMRSIVAGQVLCSIDGGSEQVLQVGTDSSPISSLLQKTLTGGNLLVEYQLSYSTNAINVNQASPAAGTPLVVTGITGAGKTPANGTWVVDAFETATSVCADLTNASPQPSSFGTLTTPFTGIATFHNSFSPLLCYGTDSEVTNAVTNLDVDYFAFVYNPKLAADFSGTADPTKPRYFAAQV